jgi:hypothetical protein
LTKPKGQNKQEAAGGGGPALAWSGDDPVAFSRAVAALEEAHIPVFKMAEHDQFTVPQISGPQYRLFVPKQSAPAAQKAIAAALTGKASKTGTKGNTKE